MKLRKARAHLRLLGESGGGRGRAALVAEHHVAKGEHHPEHHDRRPHQVSHRPRRFHLHHPPQLQLQFSQHNGSIRLTETLILTLDDQRREKEEREQLLTGMDQLRVCSMWRGSKGRSRGERDE